ncbi:MAG: ABC transporter permease subunit [Rubellimicrobium sp.]|nr:ABC transporter permease subunit [Rubellimicrobium sp.]
MSCWETVRSYALRSLLSDTTTVDFTLGGWWSLGLTRHVEFTIEVEKLLPRTDFTLCQQVTLIGSGLIWNVYFGALTLIAGFFLATAIALARQSPRALLRKPAQWFIFVFRGSPLFIQFFFGYFCFLSLKTWNPAFAPFTSAALGAAVVLFLNTAAYSAEIFRGALLSIPKGDTEAADAYGLSGWPRFRRIVWPTMLRLAWPAYTNEAIFLFHSTTLVFFSGFPAANQRGDALYYASYFADKTYNPFVPYPILAGYFILLTLIIIGLFGMMNRRLNRHLPQDRKARLRFRPAQVLR